jgi:outer membrane protein assembly factor BamB
MRSLSLRKITTGLSLLAVLVLSLTLSGMTRLATHATAATATITLSTFTGPPTTTVTIRGIGFGSSETVTATFDTSTTLGTTTTSSTESFSLGITIPSTALPGQHSIQVTGQSSGLTGSRSFLVNTNWRQFGYDQTHSRTNPYENVLSPANVSQLTLDWNYTTQSDILESSPAVVNWVVYIGSYDFNVYALDAMTGAKLWSYPTGSYVESSPAVANGVVYFGSEDFNVYAYHLPGMHP